MYDYPNWRMETMSLSHRINALLSASNPDAGPCFTGGDGHLYMWEQGVCYRVDADDAEMWAGMARDGERDEFVGDGGLYQDFCDFCDAVALSADEADEHR